MDPVHYDKIADALMQFRNKLPNWDHVHTEFGRDKVEVINMRIEMLLNAIDEFALLDQAGWVR